MIADRSGLSGGREALRDAIVRATAPLRPCSMPDVPCGPDARGSVAEGGIAIPGPSSVFHPVLDAFDFDRKSVLDICGDLGSVAREAVRRGASRAVATESDTFRALVCEMANVCEGIAERDLRIEREEYADGPEADCDLCFDFAGRSLSGRSLGHLAARTREALVVVAPPPAEGQHDATATALQDHFDFVVDLGTLAAGPSYGSDGCLFACFHANHAVWHFLLKCQSERPLLPCLDEFDLVRSDVPNLRGLMQFDVPPAEELAAIPSEIPAHEFYRLPPPDGTSERAYWLEFYRGHLHKLRSRGELSAANPYLRLIRFMVDNVMVSDPHVQSRMAGDQAYLVDRVRRRLSSFDTLSDPHPAILFDIAGQETAPVELCRGDGTVVRGARLDGYHRVAAAILAGRHTFPVYAVRIHGAP